MHLPITSSSHGLYLQFTICDPLESTKKFYDFCSRKSIYILWEEKNDFGLEGHFTFFCHVTYRKMSLKLLCWKQYLVLPERLFRVPPVSTHSESASLVGRIHLYIAPRDGHSTVTFLRSCRRLQAIALTIPNPVNHVIFGCYSRTYHSALQFGPAWRLSFLMLFGFMFSIWQKIPFR